MLSLKSNIVGVKPVSAREHNINVINSIKWRYKKLRQKSKNPTFALTYDGTYITLMKDIGFSFDEANEIVANYDKLYVESRQWKEAALKEAHTLGFGELAFGLKLRCPLYSKSVYGSGSMSKQAAGSARTLGNAFTQSYGLLNNRAVNECMDAVYDSEFATSIRPCAQIHDASYYLVREDSRAVQFLNNTLITAMSWQEWAPIQHNEVKLLANLDIYLYRWKDTAELPNNCSTEYIEEVMERVNHHQCEQA